MNTDHIKTRADLLATFRDQVTDLEKAIASGSRMLVEHGWIIVIEGFGTLIETNERRQITKVGSCGARWATGLTRADAERIAPIITNGNGATGVAMTRLAALEAELIHARECVAMMEAWPE